MICPAVHSDGQFVTSFLDHIDCQAKTLGSFGFQSLANPGSEVSVLLTGAITLMIALFGLRLMLGDQVPFRDAITGVLKIGTVLVLATSWPAVRVLLYDATFNGAQEIARPLALSSGLAPADASFTERLQAVDNQIADLTSVGTGRYQAGIIALGPHETADEAFRHTAVNDNMAFGIARILYLIAVIGPLALMRILAGFLLAVLPAVAPLFLFESTRAIVVRWLSALLASVLGTIASVIVLAMELAMLQPWLADALARRSATIAIPQAPTELLAMTLAFALIGIAMVWLLFRITLLGWHPMQLVARSISRPVHVQTRSDRSFRQMTEPSIIADRSISAADHMRSAFERHHATQRNVAQQTSFLAGRAEPGVSGSVRSLGQVYRRTRSRTTSSSRTRDARNG